MSTPFPDSPDFFDAAEFEKTWQQYESDVSFADGWRLFRKVVRHGGVSNELTRLEEEINHALPLMLTDAVTDWRKGVSKLLLKYESFLRKVGQLAFGIDGWRQRVLETRRSHRRSHDSVTSTSLFDVLLALGAIEKKYLTGEPTTEGTPHFAHEICLVYTHRNEEGHTAPELNMQTVFGLRRAVIFAYVYASCVQRALLEQRFERETVLETWRPYLDKVPERLSRLQRQGVVDLDIVEEEIPEAELVENLWDVPQMPGEIAKSEEQEVRRGTFEAMALQTERLLLLGEPGGGKTTTLVHWAVRKAKDLRDGNLDQPRIPLYIGLRSYSPVVRLKGMIAESLQPIASEAAEKLVQSFMQCEHALLLLDGLNEIGDNYREDALREIEELLESGVFAGHVVITGRMQPDHVLRRLKLPVFHIQRLSDRQITEFIQKRSKTGEDARQFLVRLKQTPAYWAWGRNPFILSMLAMVGGARGEGIPNNRAGLIESFLNKTLDRDLQKDSRQVPKQTKLHLLAELAYKTRADGKVAFPRAEGERILGDAAGAIGERLESRRDFVDEVVDNNLLAFNDDANELRFVHEVFQEYFAAKRIAGEADVLHQVSSEIITSEFWEESLSLLYDMLRSNGGSRAHELVKVLVRENLPLAARCAAAAGEEAGADRAVVNTAIETIHFETARDVDRKTTLLALFSLGDVEKSAQALCRWDDVAQRGYRKTVARAALQRVIREAVSRVRHPLEFSLAVVDWIFNHRRPLLACFAIPLFESVSADLADAADCRGPGSVVCRQVIRALVENNRATLALQWVRRLGDEDDAFLEGTIRHLVERAEFTGATRWMLAYRSRLPKLPEAIAQELIESNQWPAAANWAIDLGLSEVLADGRFVKNMLAYGKTDLALRVIHAFGFEQAFPPDAIIEKMYEQMQYDAVLRALEWYPGVSRFTALDILSLIPSSAFDADAILENEWREAAKQPFRATQERLITLAIRSGRMEQARRWAKQAGVSVCGVIRSSVNDLADAREIKRGVRLLRRILPDPDAESLILEWSKLSESFERESLLSAIETLASAIATAIRGRSPPLQNRNLRQVLNGLKGDRTSERLLQLMRKLSQLKLLTDAVWREFADRLDVRWLGPVPTITDLEDERKREIVSRWLEGKLWRAKIVMQGDDFGFASSSYFPENLFFSMNSIRGDEVVERGQWLLAAIAVRRNTRKSQWNFVVDGAFVLGPVEGQSSSRH